MNRNNLPPQAYTREVFSNAYEWLQSQPPAIKSLAKSPDELVSLYLQARRHRQPGQKFKPSSDAPVSSQSFKKSLMNLAEGMKQFEGEQDTSMVNSNADKGLTSTGSNTRDTNIHDTLVTSHPNDNPQKQSLDPRFSSSQDSTLGSTHTAPRKTTASQPNSEPRSSTAGLPSKPNLGYGPQPINPLYETVANSGQIGSDENATSGKNSSHELPESHLRAPDSASTAKEPLAHPPTNALKLHHLDQRSLEILKTVKDRFNLSSETEALRFTLSIGFEKIKALFP